VTHVPQSLLESCDELLVLALKDAVQPYGFLSLRRQHCAAAAEAADRTSGALYDHFGGKEGLYAVVVDREVRQLLGMMQDSLDAAHPRALLEQVGLVDRAHHYPVQLSGGEQQRVALARAVALDPPLLLADEPTGNLDSATGAAIIDLLFALNQDRRSTLVLVTHDAALAERADRVVSLRDGRVVGDRRREPALAP